MKRFNFINAPNLETAVNLLAEHGVNALLVAGGTNVLVDIRSGRLNGKTLINIRGISELSGISLDEHGKISIGANTTLAEMAQSELLKAHAPCLFMAANVFADPTTRNSATIGGNIAHGSPAADTAPPLLVMDATVHTLSADGARGIPIDEFFTGVNKTSLKQNEIITHFTFLPLRNSGYVKLGLRNSMAIAVVSAAAAVELDGEIIKNARVALGSVAPRPIRAKHVEEALVGLELAPLAKGGMSIRDNCHGLTGGIFAEALSDINPIDDIRASANYRRQVTPVIVKRAIKLALADCCGAIPLT